MRYTIIHHDVRDDFDLTPYEYMVCDSIHQLSHQYPTTKSDRVIAEFLGVHHTTVGKAKKVLFEKALISEVGDGVKTTKLWSDAVTYKVAKNRHGGGGSTNSGGDSTTTPLYKESKESSETSSLSDVHLSGDDPFRGVTKVPLSEETGEPTESPDQKKKVADKRKKDEVFALFSTKRQPWMISPHQKKAAIALYDYKGIQSVKKALEVVRENSDMRGCPTVTNPTQLAEKFERVVAFAKRNDLV